MFLSWTDRGVPSNGLIYKPPGHRNVETRTVDFVFSGSSLCWSLRRLPPFEPASPPVCPCSSKTSLTPPISTVGSFRSSFRPPNLSSHFPRYLLITFFPELFLWLPRHPFLSGMPLFARNVQNWIAYSAVAKDGWMDTVCGLEWWVASPLMEEKIWSVFPHQCL